MTKMPLKPSGIEPNTPPAYNRHFGANGIGEILKKKCLPSMLTLVNQTLKSFQKSHFLNPKAFQLPRETVPTNPANQTYSNEASKWVNTAKIVKTT